MFGVLNHGATPPSALFPTFEALWADLTGKMGGQGYKVVKARSHKGRARMGGPGAYSSEITRCDMVCDRGGSRVSKATTKKPWTKKTGCPWSAKAAHRQLYGGWVLTIDCDQHNHEPGTPEAHVPELDGEARGEQSGSGDAAEGAAAAAAGERERVAGGGGEAEAEAEAEAGPSPAAAARPGPRADPDTAAVLLAAGVSEAAMKLTGDTFNQLKSEYRKMTHGERFSQLSQLQLRVAAIYAIHNEELVRQQRQEAMYRQHEELLMSASQGGASQTPGQGQKGKRQRQVPGEPQGAQQQQQQGQQQQGQQQEGKQQSQQQPARNQQPPQQPNQMSATPSPAQRRAMRQPPGETPLQQNRPASTPETRQLERQSSPNQRPQQPSYETGGTQTQQPTGLARHSLAHQLPTGSPLQHHQYACNQGSGQQGQAFAPGPMPHQQAYPTGGTSSQQGPASNRQGLPRQQLAEGISQHQENDPGRPKKRRRRGPQPSPFQLSRSTESMLPIPE